MRKRIPAQIMVVTLITLMVLGIVTVSIVTTARQDVQQTVNTAQYEKLFATSEENILTILDEYGKTDATGKLVSLSTLPTSVPTGLGSCTQLSSNNFECNFNDANDADVESVLIVRDITDFDDYELGKDQSLTLNLGGYQGEVRLEWSGNAAIDLGLVYSDFTGNYQIVRDLFDPTGLLDSSGGNPFTDPQPGGLHPFPFVSFNTPTSNSFRFNISSIDGLPIGATTELLTITARIPATSGVIALLDFEADALQPQMREVLATSDNIVDPVSSTATARTLLPLYPQNYSLLEYGILLNSQLAK